VATPSLIAWMGYFGFERVPERRDETHPDCG
jgi:hypothetical protein